MTEALFQYRLRVSSRTRNVRLRVTVRGGLEVIVPTGYDHAKVAILLEGKKHWIRTALDRAEANRKFFEPEPAWSVPHEIRLRAIGKVWHVKAKRTNVPWVAVRELSGDQLLIFGGIQDHRATREALARWLMRLTRIHLVPRLRTLSLRTGLPYRRAFVRRQKTRWASCSRHKSISLNTKLLFLPSHLVDYVMVHELCHLVEMNHSKRFWWLVEKHCGEFRKCDQELRQIWKSLPRWLT